MLLVILSVRKAPASIALMAASIFAGILGVFTQYDVVRAFVADPGLDPVRAGIQAVWQAMATGF